MTVVKLPNMYNEGWNEALAQVEKIIFKYGEKTRHFKTADCACLFDDMLEEFKELKKDGR